MVSDRLSSLSQSVLQITGQHASKIAPSLYGTLGASSRFFFFLHVPQIELSH